MSYGELLVVVDRTIARALSPLFTAQNSWTEVGLFFWGESQFLSYGCEYFGTGTVPGTHSCTAVVGSGSYYSCTDPTTAVRPDPTTAVRRDP